MSDPFRKLRPGDNEISTEGLNAALDAGRYVRDRLRDGGDGLKGTNPPPGVVLVRNVSGESVPRFGVLALREPIVTPEDNLAEFQRRVNFDGDLPDEETDEQCFAVMQEPVADGAVGRGVVSGVTVARVSISNAAQWFANLAEGETDHLVGQLEEGPAKILYTGQDEDGNDWAYVDLRQTAPCVVLNSTTTTQPPPPGGCYGTCVWTWASGTASWTLTSTTCPECVCDHPRYCGSSACEVTRTGCRSTGSPTTTTPRCGGDDGTTPAPCTKSCAWIYLSALRGWVQLYNHCAGGDCACESEEPPSAPGSDCERRESPCVYQAPPPPCCEPDCVYLYWHSPPFCPVWIFLGSRCSCAGCCTANCWQPTPNECGIVEPCSCALPPGPPGWFPPPVGGGDDCVIVIVPSE